jgi:hypothetical protein
MPNPCTNRDCLTYNDGDGYTPSQLEVDRTSGLCAECLLDRARTAIGCCTPENELRDDHALAVLAAALYGEEAVRLVRRQIVRANEQATIEQSFDGLLARCY